MYILKLLKSLKEAYNLTKKDCCVCVCVFSNRYDRQWVSRKVWIRDGIIRPSIINIHFYQVNKEGISVELCAKVLSRTYDLTAFYPRLIIEAGLKEIWSESLQFKIYSASPYDGSKFLNGSKFLREL